MTFIIRALVFYILLLIPVAQAAFCQTDNSIKSGDQKSITKEIPVVQWTANRDEMNFRYNFLENTKTITLYTATPETGTYNHSNYIFYFQGVMFAVWSNHLIDEGASGQRILMSRSTDQGKTWTAFEELFPPMDRQVPSSEAFIGTRTQGPKGFAIVDNNLYAVSGVSDWGGTDIAHRIRIRKGYLARTVGSDGTLGEPFWMRKDPVQPKKGFPQYPVGNPMLIEKIKQYLQFPAIGTQFYFTDLKAPPTVSDDDHKLVEPTPAWKLKDGTWVKLFRDAGFEHLPNLTREQYEESKSRRNYATFSFDDGITWTTPTRTSFPDACARSNAGKLPDGQVYVINNVLPLSTKKGGRSLLAISLSRDGLNFDRVAVIRFIPPVKRFKGRAKSIGFQYPHSVIVVDNLWVMHSINKEDIEVTRIPLNELYKIK